MYNKTADEILRLNPELAIIPVGSIEQHGPHLPVMTDWAIASELGKRVAEKNGCIFSARITDFHMSGAYGQKRIGVDGTYNFLSDDDGYYYVFEVAGI